MESVLAVTQCETLVICDRVQAHLALDRRSLNLLHHLLTTRWVHARFLLGLRAASSSSINLFFDLSKLSYYLHCLLIVLLIDPLWGHSQV